MALGDKKPGFERPSPSQMQEREQARAKEAQEQAEALERRKARVAKAFDALLKTEDGRVVWGWLFERCGYARPVLMRMASGDIAPLSTEAAAAQREVYRDARRMISNPELLVVAEFEAEHGPEIAAQFVQAVTEKFKEGGK